MPYKVTAPLVIARSREGELCYHYRDMVNIGAPINYGSVIPWLNDEQAEHFTKLGLVERIEEEIPLDTGKVVVESDSLQDCLKALERLEVDRDGPINYQTPERVLA